MIISIFSFFIWFYHKTDSLWHTTLPIWTICQFQYYNCYVLDQRSARGAGAVIISRRISEMINDKFLTLSKDTRILVYCWRGGLRSKSLAVILNQCGFNNLKLLKGGYKNFRNLVTSSLNEMIQSHQYMVLAGNTGSGKDIFIFDPAMFCFEILSILNCSSYTCFNIQLSWKGRNVYHLHF